VTSRRPKTFLRYCASNSSGLHSSTEPIRA
jgi:hypothetical protein